MALGKLNKIIYKIASLYGGEIPGVEMPLQELEKYSFVVNTDVRADYSSSFKRASEVRRERSGLARKINH